jgi:hypothetical protein
MLLQKLCCRCKQERPVEQFYANTRMKDGRNTFCIDCHKSDNRERKNKLRSTPEFRATEQAYKKAYREQTKGQQAEYMAQWREKNKVQINAYGRQYREKRKDHYSFLCQKRKIALLNRTPAWLTEDDFWVIEQAYELAALRTKLLGVEFHVDHVIPLRGKTVSGLHVPQNIRVVTWLENQRKTNKFEV